MNPPLITPALLGYLVELHLTNGEIERGVCVGISRVKEHYVLLTDERPGAYNTELRVWLLPRPRREWKRTAGEIASITVTLPDERKQEDA